MNFARRKENTNKNLSFLEPMKDSENNVDAIYDC